MVIDNPFCQEEICELSTRNILLLLVFVLALDKERLDMIGTTEIIVIVGTVLVLFGATAVPKFARSIGKTRSEFEKGLKEGQEVKDEKEDKSTKKEKRE